MKAPNSDPEITLNVFLVRYYALRVRDSALGSLWSTYAIIPYYIVECFAKFMVSCLQHFNSEQSISGSYGRTMTATPDLLSFRNFASYQSPSAPSCGRRFGNTLRHWHWGVDQIIEIATYPMNPLDGVSRRPRAATNPPNPPATWDTRQTLAQNRAPEMFG